MSSTSSVCTAEQNCGEEIILLNCDINCATAADSLCKSGVFFKTRTIQIRTTQNRTKQGPTVFLGI